MVKTYDPEVYKLAMMFVGDAPEFESLTDDEKAMRADGLALDIQQAIEDFFYTVINVKS